MRAPLVTSIVLALSLAVLPAPAGEDIGEKAVVMLESMAKIVHADRDECPKMKTDLEKFVADNAELTKKIEVWSKGLTRAEREAWAKKYKARLEAAQATLTTHLGKCASAKP